MTKELLLRKTYEKVEQLFRNHRITPSQWEWYQWKFGQTSMQLQAWRKGLPEPDFDA